MQGQLPQFDYAISVQTNLTCKLLRYFADLPFVLQYYLDDNPGKLTSC